MLVEREEMKRITFGYFDRAFGQIILGRSDKGLCWLGFMVEGRKGDGLSRMKVFYEGADFVHDDAAVADLADAVMQAWEHGEEKHIKVDLSGGTDFQQRVWRALLDIRRGQVRTYGEVASAIGRPKAIRAVGSAVGANPVSLIIPCHRVVPASSGVGYYGWGAEIKEKLLLVERG